MQNNPITEVILGILAVLFIAGGVFLLYVGKIDFAGATLMFGFPAALFGINQALKAPSPAQQQNLQQVISDLTNVIPVIFQHTHAAPSAPPVIAPAPVAVQPPTESRVSAQQLLAQPLPPEYFAPVQPAQPVPPMPVAPQVQQMPFQAGNTFPQPVMPQ